MKRIISLVLAILTVLSLAPFSAFAEGEEAVTEAAETVTEEAAEEKEEKAEKPAKEEKSEAEPVAEKADAEPAATEAAEEKAEQKAEAEEAEKAEEPAEETAEETEQQEEAPAEDAEAGEAEEQTEETAEKAEEQTEEPTEEAEEQTEEQIEEALPVTIDLKKLKDATVTGGVATFTVKAEASDGSALSYQWQQLDTAVDYKDDAERAAAWTDIEGEDEATLKLKDITAESFAADYAKLVFRCVVTAADGTVADGTVAVTDEVKLVADPEWSEQEEAADADEQGEEQSEEVADGEAEQAEEPATEGEQGEATEEAVTDGEAVTEGEQAEETVTEEGAIEGEATEETANEGEQTDETVTNGETEQLTDPFAEDELPITEGDTDDSSITASGTCGDDLTWVLTDDGVLTISGTGEMTDYNESSSPWYSYFSCITTVTIDAGVTSIGNYAFYYCNVLTYVTIPNSVTNIGSHAFLGCSGLTTVAIPGRVTNIGAAAFQACTSLTSVIIADGVTSVGSSAFDGCKALTSIVIPDSVKSIGDNAFYGCIRLTSVAIPNGVTIVKSHTFFSCGDLTSVTIPNSVTCIEDNAFERCISLTSVTIPDNVTSIGDNAFLDCSSLTSISLGESIEDIGDFAFAGTGLKAIIFPAGVKNIGLHLFWHCGDTPTISSITFMGNAPTHMNSYAFYHVTGIAYYRVGTSWTEAQKTNYGGNLTWVGYCNHKYDEITHRCVYCSDCLHECDESTHRCVYCGAWEEGYDFAISLDDVTVKGPTEVSFKGTFTAVYPEPDDTYLLCLNYYKIVNGEYEYFTTCNWNIENDCVSKEFSETTVYFHPGTKYAVQATIATEEDWLNPVIQTEFCVFSTESGAKIESAQLSTRYIFPTGETANVLKFTSCFDDLTKLAIIKEGECWVLLTDSEGDTDELYFGKYENGEFLIGSGETAYLVCPSEEAVTIQIDYIESYKNGFELTLNDVNVVGPTEVYISGTVTAVYQDVDHSYEIVFTYYEEIDGEYRKQSHSDYILLHSTDVDREFVSHIYCLKPGTKYELRANIYKVGSDDVEPVLQCITQSFTTESDEHVEKLLLGKEYLDEPTENARVLKYEAKYTEWLKVDADGQCYILSNSFWYDDGVLNPYLETGKIRVKRGETIYIVCPSPYTATTFTISSIETETYSINYFLNGGTNAVSNPTLYDLGDSVTLRTPTRTGYAFAGWYLDDGYTMPATAPEITPETSGNITFYAKWVSNTNKVAFNPNTGKGKMAAVSGIQYDEEYTLPLNTFTKKGYAFTGWSLSANGSTGIVATDGGTIKNLTESIGATVTLYAQWTPADYAITYELFGGTNNPQNPAYYTMTDATIQLVAPSTAPAGCSFAGWYSDTAFKKKVTQIKKGSVGDITLYAKWNATPYTLTYILNGGANPKTAAKTYTIASPAVTLPTPTRKGYTFMGWYEDEALTEGPVESIPTGTTGNKTFYAKWDLATYSITYVLSVGENDPENPASYAMTSGLITLKAPTVPAGVTFGGWYSDAKLKKKVTVIKTGSTGNLTLYAKLTGTSYKITYSLNGGKNASANPKTYMALTGDVALQDATKKGYTFTGWYKSASCTGEPITVLENGTTGAVTLYAGWEITIYSITYVLNGGRAASNPEEYNILMPTFTPTAPTKANCTFGGWYSDATLKKKVSSIKKGSVGDITLYAKWTNITYKVSFNANGGKGKMAALTYKCGYLYKLPACVYTKKGYTFAGWNTKKDGTGAGYDDAASVYNLLSKAGTVTLYAQWR